jgi:hypothetical protein
MISRSQMNRQLYMGGGITQLSMNEIMVPRGEYGLGSIVKSVGKAVKGVTKGIGDIAKSDIGKAALLAAGTYYAQLYLVVQLDLVQHQLMEVLLED